MFRAFRAVSVVDVMHERLRVLRLFAVPIFATVVFGCGADREPAAPPSNAAPLLQVAPDRPRIVVLGDSITAGLGLLSEQSYPAILQQRLDADGYDFEVINAGVSGDTSAGGLRRLDWALDGDVRILIIALGGNDGLRGLPPEEMRRNLAAIIERAQARQIGVVLAGMEAPPNFGPDYTRRFRQAFQELAVGDKVAFVPFLLDGVAGVAGLNQADGIHPTADGARIVADHVWATLKPVVDAVSTQ